MDNERHKTVGMGLKIPEGFGRELGGESLYDEGVSSRSLIGLCGIQQ